LLGGYRILILFFFQAEDGIRDFHVTGVQTCALPISSVNVASGSSTDSSSGSHSAQRAEVKPVSPARISAISGPPLLTCAASPSQIGRASCRERVEIGRVAAGGRQQRRKTLRAQERQV